MEHCNICKNECLSSSHKSSDKHRFNYLLHEWNSYRKKLVKNRDGITISQEMKPGVLSSIKSKLDEKKGRYTVTLTSEQLSSMKDEISFTMEVRNDRRENVMYIMKANVLVPYKAFSIHDKCNSIIKETVLELNPKASYTYDIKFKLPDTLIGSYKIPLAFTFQQQDSDTVSFSMAREIVIVVSDFNPEPEDKSKNPFKYDVWDDVQLYIPPISVPPQLNNYPIPRDKRRIFMTGLNDNCRDPNEQTSLNFVKECLCPNYRTTGEFIGQYPTEKNYKNFFHFLLWIDEVMQRLMLQRFNMSNVTMKIINGNMLELEVPGLAEKRPSLVTGDLVNIRFHQDHTAYKAVVCKINDKTIWINKMDQELVHAIERDKSIELDVSFDLNRLSYERMHKAIDVCIHNDLLKVLFPSVELSKTSAMKKYSLPDNRFINKNILSNTEQKNAVINILNGTSRHAPYIVYGPPGTGKTLTIVEAILQIKQHITSSKILICAPANAACDMLAEKLVPFVGKEELIRIHTESRFWEDVPDKIKPYSNHDGKDFIRIPANKLNQYRIVVTTLVLIGKYSGYYNPDHVFIDEAAQALEPEANIAVSMLSVGKQLILAGDPKQLGPQCASKLAAKLKLENSLLERLMDTNPLYQNGDNRFITMLKQNYRAHPQVLHIPNKLFYDDKLTAVSREALLDPIAQVFIHPLTLPKSSRLRNTRGAPIEFCSVIAKEQREGKSPSYFNEAEIQMVMKYINAILSLPNIDVSQHDIGIIAPYIRQVHRIKTRLHKKGYNDVEVGTTEAFQGREKRIIIISTVRGQNNLLLFDKKYNLGFVTHEKRMNVALTRAKSKLILIGNPHVLGTDKNWEEYIQYCEENQAFFGAQYLRRTDAVRNDICGRFSGIKLGDSKAQAPNSNNKNQRGTRRRAK